MMLPTPALIRQEARRALCDPCTCGQCPTDEDLRAILALTDAELWVMIVHRMLGP